MKTVVFFVYMYLAYFLNANEIAFVCNLNFIQVQIGQSCTCNRRKLVITDILSTSVIYIVISPCVFALSSFRCWLHVFNCLTVLWIRHHRIRIKWLDSFTCRGMHRTRYMYKWRCIGTITIHIICVSQKIDLWMWYSVRW